MDIKKYLKNKDVKIDNEDIDFDAISKDVLKGYVKETDIKDNISKETYNELTSKYATLETNYNNTIKTLGDTNEKLAKVSLEKTMISKGFKEEQFDKVSKMRGSLYADIKDDGKAIDTIATDFKATFFPDDSAKNPVVPNEASFTTGSSANNGTDIHIVRDTPLRNMTLPVK